MIDKNLPRIILGEFFDVPNRDSILASRDVMVQNESQRKEIRTYSFDLRSIGPAASQSLISGLQIPQSSPSSDFSLPNL